MKALFVALLSLAPISNAFVGPSRRVPIPPLAMAGSSDNSAQKVAVTGTTGRLGRQAILQLDKANVRVKALIRKPVDIADKSIAPSIAKDATGAQVAAYLAALPNVELVLGDITDKASLEALVKDCTAVLALHGPRPTGLKSLCPPLNPESDPSHARSINYVGVQHLIDACIKSKTCRRIVRVTGKGEAPYSFFSILINMLGSMAKAWNYEGEQLLRIEGPMRSFVLVACLACAGAFSLSAAPQSTRVVVAASSAEIVMFGGGKKAAPKKAVKKAAAKKAAPVKKPVAKKVVKKPVAKKAPPAKKPVAKKAPPAKKPVAKKVVRKAPVRKGEPNIINKLFAMPFIGGGKGVTLGPEYDL